MNLSDRQFAVDILKWAFGPETIINDGDEVTGFIPEEKAEIAISAEYAMGDERRPLWRMRCGDLTCEGPKLRPLTWEVGDYLVDKRRFADYDV